MVLADGLSGFDRPVVSHVHIGLLCESFQKVLKSIFVGAAKSILRAMWTMRRSEFRR